MAHTAARPPACTCLMARPSGDLLLHRPTKSGVPERFFRTNAIASVLAGFEDRYNAVSQPFDWRFTKDDLNELLARIAAHEQAAPLPLAAAA